MAQDGDAKSVRSLLGGAKFAIDYYQREYLWETKQVAELIDDLAKKFLESHEPGNEAERGGALVHNSRSRSTIVLYSLIRGSP